MCIIYGVYSLISCFQEQPKESIYDDLKLDYAERLPILSPKKEEVINEDGATKQSIMWTSAIMLGILHAASELCWLYSINYISVGLTAFIISLQVVLVPIFEYIRSGFQEGVSVVSIAALIISFTALLLIFGVIDHGIENIDKLIGISLSLSTALCYGGNYIINSNVASENYTKLEIIEVCLMTFLIESSLLVFISFTFDFENTVNSMDIIRENIGPITWIAMSTVLNNTIIILAQNYVSAFPTALIFSCDSIFAAIFGYLLLSQILNSFEITGCILISLATVSVVIERNFMSS
jgi:drug/metabolite transporter (DMT)-like permease